MTFIEELVQWIRYIWCAYLLCNTVGSVRLVVYFPFITLLLKSSDIFIRFENFCGQQSFLTKSISISLTHTHIKLVDKNEWRHNTLRDTIAHLTLENYVFLVFFLFCFCYLFCFYWNGLWLEWMLIGWYFRFCQRHFSSASNWKCHNDFSLISLN